MANILIIDDDPLIRDTLSLRVQRLGHLPATAGSLADGMEQALAVDPDMVFLDVRLPDGNGLTALPGFKDLDATPEVVIITGVGDAEGAELAIRSGAWDYLQKPFARGEIDLQITRALDYRRQKRASQRVFSVKRDAIIGKSPPIKACLDQVAQSASTASNVLITGETGTGKELFARAIHENSDRADKPFVVVDCAALPGQLVESLLFGHVKGAFTGADRNQVGLIKEADGGTLFLDEIGELPLSVQRTFLRALQERKFRPVGRSQELESDFRLVAATNRDLDEMVAKGTFRKDLLFRLRTLHIQLPPLSSRREDIPDLATHYIHRLCKRQGLKPKGMVPEFIEILEEHDWPGNVRELVNTLEAAISRAPDAVVLFPLHLPPALRIGHAKSAVSGKNSGSTADEIVAFCWTPPADPESAQTFKELRNAVMARLEYDYFKYLLNACDGRIDTVCKVSGLGKSRLYALLQKHGLQKS